MLSRSDARDMQSVARRMADKSASLSGGDPAFSRMYGTVVKVYDDGRLDVNTGSEEHPSVQYGLRMTTACSGVSTNDRVVIDTYAHVPLVTGVLAHDNSDYVTAGEIPEIVYGLSMIRSGVCKTSINNGNYVYITAPAVEGYRFVTWTNVATIGTVQQGYIEDCTMSSTTAWFSATFSGTVCAYCLYLRSS